MKHIGTWCVRARACVFLFFFLVLFPFFLFLFFFSLFFQFRYFHCHCVVIMFCHLFIVTTMASPKIPTPTLFLFYFIYNINILLPCLKTEHMGQCCQRFLVCNLIHLVNFLLLLSFFVAILSCPRALETKSVMYNLFNSESNIEV